MKRHSYTYLFQLLLGAGLSTAEADTIAREMAQC
jgi:hypothetical protein